MRREDLAWLLDLANDMRIAKGDEQLNDLPQANKGQPRSCLIANAFNYGCSVYPAPRDEIFNAEISFKTQEDLDTYLKITGIENHRIDEAWGTYTAQLTPELNDLAIKFDQGKIPEYILEG
jgi:hypothetical protein